MEPELIWTNIAIGVNVVFEDLAQMRKRHIVSCKRVVVQAKM